MTDDDTGNAGVSGDWVEVDEDVAEEADEGTTGAAVPDPGTPTDLEKSLFRTLATYDIDLKKVKRHDLIFSPNARWEIGSTGGNRLPRDRAGELHEQLDKKPRISSRWAGIVIESEGFIEVLLRPNTQFMIRDQLVRSCSRLVTDGDESCPRHNEQDRTAFPIVTFPRISGGYDQFRLHLTEERCCVELSTPSVACHILTNEGISLRPRYLASVKVAFGRAMSLREVEDEAEPIINSLIYELDVRNNVKTRAVRWPSKSDRRPFKRSRPNRVIRFPQTKIDPEVSVLFGFAGSASGNPPLAFLSYYQVLENFFPLATRRSAIRKLELELSDPRFDRRDDKYLMRLLAVGENAAAVSESVQLRTLLEEFVRATSLNEFFTETDWGKHFTKNGPIQGISDSINTENRSKPLAHQVADRVYRIRNRIVHAKDDPKYESVPALLPQSEEAEALWPDIELVRNLAFEVILSAQARSK
jgi:hypothetical protein